LTHGAKNTTDPAPHNLASQYVPPVIFPSGEDATPGAEQRNSEGVANEASVLWPIRANL